MVTQAERTFSAALNPIGIHVDNRDTVWLTTTISAGHILIGGSMW